MTLHEEMSMAAHARIAEPLSHAGAPARPAPQERTPLSVVPAPLPRSRSGMTVLCVVVLLAALAAVLVMNITMSNRQYALLDLRQEQQAVTEVNERLAEQVGYLEAPQNVAARADALGMVAPAGTASVDAATGEFRGEAQPAREGEISATFVAPPVNADAVRQGSAGSADADRGDIEGPRTLAAPAAAPGAAASDDRDASDR